MSEVNKNYWCAGRLCEFDLPFFKKKNGDGKGNQKTVERSEEGGIFLCSSGEGDVKGPRKKGREKTET